MSVEGEHAKEGSFKTEPDQEQLNQGFLNEGKVLVGVNVVDLARLSKALERGDRFVKHCFTEDELLACKGMPQVQMGYASRFAAKIAVCKALGVDRSSYICPRSIEIVQGAKGRPSARLSGRIADIAHTLGVTEIPLSFSYTHTEAAACAMAITRDSVTKAKQRVNQKQELAKRFREARSVLDELPGTEPVYEQAALPGLQ